MTRIPKTFQGSPANAGEPWIGYIRVSTYYEDKISPDIQRTAIQAWADRNGKRIVEWIEDLDISGRTFKRKVMLGIKATEEGRVRGIAVWRYSRFGRSRHGNAVNLAKLEGVGGRLESATEAVDTRTAFGRLQMGLAFKFAEFESDRIGEQWEETREHRRAHGLPSTGGKRWGYVWNRRHMDDDGLIHPESYEPDRELDLLVLDLYERVADGQALYSLTQWLGRKGYVGTRGNPWTQTALTRYLDSGFPAGFLRYHPTECECPPNDPESNMPRSAKCSNRIWTPGAQELIVKEDVWEEYERRRKIAKSKPATNRAAAYPNSGQLRCARCGGSGTFAGGSTYGAGGVLIQKQGYQARCGERKDKGTCDGFYILRSVIEATVLKRLEEWQREIEAEVARSKATRKPKEKDARSVMAPEDRLAAERKRLKKRLTDIAAEMDQQTSLVSRKIIPEESYRRERDRLMREQTAVTEQLTALETPEGQQVERADYLPVIRGLVARWEVTTVETRRALLRTLLKGVWIYPKTVGDDGEEIPAYAVPVPAWEPTAPELIGRRAAA
ncbi:recombinase family protein [Streptomyces sp. NPDC056500]|uniref:recombinase family protein n=1 Tax=Streptomyces sp. NPDC056500 TaxID=3345840 RepID=UPI003683063D